MYHVRPEGERVQSVEELLALKEKAERRKKELEAKLAQQEGEDMVKAALGRVRKHPARFRRKTSRQKDLSLFSFIVQQEAADSGSSDKLDFLEKRLGELRKRRESIIQEAVVLDSASSDNDDDDEEDGSRSASQSGSTICTTDDGSQSESEEESSDTETETSDQASNSEGEDETEGLDHTVNESDDESSSEGKGEGTSRDDESATDSPAEEETNKDILNELRAACATLPEVKPLVSSPSLSSINISNIARDNNLQSQLKDSAPARLSREKKSGINKSASRRDNLKMMSNASKPFYNKEGSARGKQAVAESAPPAITTVESHSGTSSPYIGYGSGSPSSTSITAS
eukprot:TRINITY_DN5326_c0_g1_i2.p1 TRINITY_DN5326_c0_g1~~TRINITY_DN5326_c0_g1_i2.p1  ORF type:complete len:344 (-),score=98.40 TRINITY_DN5326_c0_g1_i2:68-1099(-)